MKSNKNIFIGVAWPYVNGDLHVGHVAGYLLPADITARFYRLLGNDVLMVSGSDCYGTPITIEADKMGVSPSEIVDKYHTRNVKLFDDLDLSFDLYTKTLTENHKKITQDFLKAFWKKDLLEIKSQKQYFSESLNKFLPDRYVEGECPHCGFKESRSDQCDNCGNLLEQNLKNPISKIDKESVDLKDTQHLFIRWDKLQPDIEKYVRSKTGWREWVEKETKNWLNLGLKPRAVTRDLDWGVEIPKEITKNLDGAENKRIYVWFDAVIGYYSASVEWAEINKKDWKDYWYNNNSTHYYFMGKDNLVFHTIFWPGQLIVFDKDINLPDYPVINQFLNFNNQKFSKSRGVTVDSSEFIQKFGSDALRFYLTTIMPENADSNFAWEDFFKKNNDILVGHFGNYIHRTLSVFKDEIIKGDISKNILKQIEETTKFSIKYLKKSEFKNYYLELERLAKFANGYFNDCKPWVTKKNNPQKFQKDGADLLTLSYALGTLLEPITPEASKKFLEMIGAKDNLLWKNADNLNKILPTVLANIQISTPTLLFHKIEPET